MRASATTTRGVHGPLASVRPDAGDWHIAHVPLVDLGDLHWDEARSASPLDPGPTLCGFTSCESVVAGELPHADCAHGHPHAVRVCILREDNDRAVFERLRLEAGPPPRRFRR